MSASILLNSVIDKLKINYPAGLSEDKLFEFYVADNFLVNFDLDHKEIEAGIVDGPKDGGIDAAYVFVNRNLLTEDFKLTSLKQPVEIELVIIQAKNQDSFKEGPFDKLNASLPLLLDAKQSKKDIDALFKKEVVTIFQAFLKSVEALAVEFPKVSIRIFYASKGDKPNEVVKAKATVLKATVEQFFPEVSVEWAGAQDLYNSSSRQKRLVKALPIAGSPLSGKDSFVALAKLKDYAAFVSAEDGSLVARIFDANVRAYQGEVEVNVKLRNLCPIQRMASTSGGSTMV